MTKNARYHIRWIDTFSTDLDGWAMESRIAEEAKKHTKFIHTVGFYVGYYHGFEVFAGDRIEEPNHKSDSYSALTFIPQGCIKSRSLLKT